MILGSLLIAATPYQGLAIYTDVFGVDAYTQILMCLYIYSKLVMYHSAIDVYRVAKMHRMS